MITAAVLVAALTLVGTLVTAWFARRNSVEKMLRDHARDLSARLDSLESRLDGMEVELDVAESKLTTFAGYVIKLWHWCQLGHRGEAPKPPESIKGYLEGM